MAEINLPDFSLIWSSAGDILQPPDAKIQQGWLSEVPPRQWFNWLDNRQDEAIAHIAQHGIAVWSDVLEYQAGKSYVQGSDGIVYKAITTNTNVNPVGNVGDWQSAFLAADQAVQVATAAQSRAMTANNVYLSPLQLSNAFTGTNQSLGASGWQKFPGGLIAQWGVTGQISSTTADVSFNFPQAFTTIYQVFLFPGVSTSSSLVATQGNFTNTGFTFSVWNSSGARTLNNAVRYLAIGL